VFWVNDISVVQIHTFGTGYTVKEGLKKMLRNLTHARSHPELREDANVASFIRADTGSAPDVYPVTALHAGSN
jgi:hypothetical protein